MDDDTVIVWKDFENCFTMIGIGKGYTEKVIRDFLDVVFNATIFSIGLNEVKHNKNPEQLKRELKVIILSIFHFKHKNYFLTFISFNSKNVIRLLTN